MRYLLILLVLLLGCSGEQEQEYSINDPYCGQPPSVDQKIWTAEYINRATLASVNTHTEAIGHGFRAYRTFTFTVHEWLKGTGPASITVLPPRATYGYEDVPPEEWADIDSRELAIFVMGSRDTTYDDRQSLLFLAKDGDTWTFDVGHCPDFDVSIDANHRVWLPATSVTGDVDATSFMTGADSSITLSTVKSKVTEIANVQASPEEGYAECYLDKISMRQLYGDEVTFFERNFTFGSGLPSQVMTVATKLDHYWLKGEDASLFEPSGRTVVNVRPLPGGEYTFTRHYQAPRWVVCDFRPEYNGPDAFTVTVNAPADVTHETLFDPMDRRNGTRVGELHLSSHVSQLLWFSDGTPRVEIQTSTRLTDKVVEIIANDGTVSHEFYSDDSTKVGQDPQLAGGGEAVERGGQADGEDKGGPEPAAGLHAGQRVKSFLVDGAV